MVDDRLLVSAVCTISHRRGDAEKLREFVNRKQYLICQHVCTNVGCYPGEQYRLPEIDANASSREDGYFAPCARNFRSCPICMMDCRVDVLWQGTEKGWNIEITSYYQLGSCRSPFDWNWEVMTDIGCGKKPRALNPSKYSPGIVRHRWSSAHDAVLEPEGEWVGDFDTLPWRSTMTAPE